MDLEGRCAIVTGGGHGIGRALVEALAARGARVVVADVNRERADKIATRVGGLAVSCDVADPSAVADLAEQAEDAFGPVTVAVSNAGVTDLGPDLDSTVDQVRRIVGVNLLAHVWLAQAVLPGMVERGSGALVQTVSSAALITGPSGMGYTLTKHGALGFAEWVALNFGHRGVRVVCLCPNAVNTGMLGRDEDRDEADQVVAPELVAALGDVVEPEDCAAAALAALDDGRFLALPHPRVGESFLRKAQDYDAWLARTAERLRRMRGEGSDVLMSAR
jgi:NAD(P)-dependent dehydrogenase (short-subunit alcohol dehydrogenase family)